jgi:hypothetical protein
MAGYANTIEELVTAARAQLERAADSSLQRQP